MHARVDDPLIPKVDFDAATKDRRAWNAGQRAAEHGQGLDICPYRDGPSRDTWLVAWLVTHTRHAPLTHPELLLD